MNVMEGLYNIDFTDYSVISGLAAGDPVEVDANTYEVTLRDGAKFSDGTDVTADDVASSFERATAEGGLYVSFLTMFDSIEKKDDKTVTVKVSIPNFSLLKERLAIIKVMPSSLSADDAKAKPVGSGPWMYTEVSDTYATLAPNPNYNGEFPAKDNELRIESLTDTTARVTAQQEGTTLVTESVPPESIDQLKAAGCDVDQVNGFGTRFIMFNVKKAPWDDVKVRQAIMYALNTEQMIANAFSGLAAIPTCYLPESFTNYHKAANTYTYDADKAKSMLSEAGVTPGRPRPSHHRQRPGCRHGHPGPGGPQGPWLQRDPDLRPVPGHLRRHRPGRQLLGHPHRPWRPVLLRRRHRPAPQLVVR